MSRFAGRTAVVTGGAGAIGRATACRLGDEGARVLVVDLDEDAMHETIASIRSSGGEAEGCVSDVSLADDAERYASAAAALGGGEIHLFFNNAGTEGPIGLIEEISDQAFDRVMAVNVRGVYLGLKHVLPHMQRGAAIVNTGSVASIRGTARLAAYVASKHAVLGLTRSVAREVAPRGIRVNAVCPSGIEGPMMTRIEEAYDEVGRERFKNRVPLERYGTAEEVAATVAFLLSDDASFATGGAYVLDGGQSA